MAKNGTFWLAKTPYIGATEYVLYNREPYKTELWYPSRIKYYDDMCWWSLHGSVYLGKHSYEKFKDVDHNTAIPVRLVPSKSETPDVYVQRYFDCLFIDNHLTTCRVAKPREKKSLLGYRYDWVDETGVRHCHMISNKLFPAITMETGYVGMDIERL